MVLYLPPNREEWLVWSKEELALRKCSWWVSLRKAPPSDNKSGLTIYLPEEQVFNPESLRDIMTRLSREEELLYAG